jgi:hypothetical protein
MIPSLSAVLISTIYCFWSAYAREAARRRERLLRERVAYLLWAVVDRA